MYADGKDTLAQDGGCMLIWCGWVLGNIAVLGLGVGSLAEGGCLSRSAVPAAQFHEMRSICVRVDWLSCTFRKDFGWIHVSVGLLFPRSPTMYSSLEVYLSTERVSCGKNHRNPKL